MADTINKNVKSLSRAILASYRRERGLARIGQWSLPSRSRIVDTLAEIQRLLFPGFFGTKQLTDETVAYHVGSQLTTIAKTLTEEIRHCLCTDRACTTCRTEAQCKSKAESAALAFFQRIPAIRRMLADDAQAAYDGDPAAKSIDEIIYSYPGFFAVSVYRIAHELLALGIPLMPRIMTEHAHSVTGCDIHPGATIGKRFFVDHATGVVIGETSKIGANVKIYQGVTLGARSFPKDERGRAIKGLQRHPTIENNVTIYANATILGGDTVIGKGATVNGNTFVMQSVKSGTTVSHKSPELQLRQKRSKKKK